MSGSDKSLNWNIIVAVICLHSNEFDLMMRQKAVTFKLNKTNYPLSICSLYYVISRVFNSELLFYIMILSINTSVLVLLRTYKWSILLNIHLIGPGIPLNCIPGNPGFNSSPPNPLGLPCSGTTVFPLPGSFPWTAGNRGIQRRLIF